MVDGYGRTANSNIGGEGIANHSWNAVMLNGSWKLCDATWSSGVVDSHTGIFIPRYTDAYFLPSPELFARNHYPVDTAWLLTKTKPTLKYFLEAPLVYRAFFKTNIEIIYPDTFERVVQRNESVRFSFYQSKDSSLEWHMMERNSKQKINPVCVADGISYFEYSFSSRGEYSIYFFVDSEVAVSYKVKVR
jgi:transglutaminase/protease-like cytokinesis protein 3